MEQQSVIHNTFVIERSYPVTQAQVFAAFADPIRKRRWFVEGHHSEVEHYELDFRVGGVERGHFRFKEDSPLPGMTCKNETIFLDIVADRRIVFASTMTIGENRISVSLVTFEFLAGDPGNAKAMTDLICTHQAAFFEGADGPEIRQQGWSKLLEKLTAELSTGQ